MASRTQAIQAVLSHRRFGVALGLVAPLLGLPALWAGLHSDDHAHRLAVQGQATFPAQSGSPMGLFSFADGDPERNHEAMETGLLPWWSVEKLRINFWRPLTALTHIFDYRIWPETPVLMHAQSLVWFGGLVVLAALFYRRILGATWAAGAAAFLFAVDDAHAIAATWLASRNVLVSGVFALLALIAHDRWRRDSTRLAGVAAPVFLLLGLLGGEAALATAGYLLAYALFLERGTWRVRIASLLPAAVVCVGWYVVYSRLGYGTFGSDVYIDPGREPLRFGGVLLDRGAFQLLAQWAFPPTDYYPAFSQGLARAVWLTAIAVTVLLVAVLGPLVRIDRRARFFAVGMLLALVPNSTTIPSDRMLTFVGLGGMGLLAMLIRALAEHDPALPRFRIWQIPARVFVVLLILIHTIAAPILLPVRAAGHRDPTKLPRAFAALLPDEPATANCELFIVNAPSGLWGAFLHITRLDAGLAVPRRACVLATGVRGVRVTRRDEDTLVVRPVGGYLAPARTPPSAAAAPPSISMAYLLQRADLVFRSRGQPMGLGQHVELGGLTVEVTALTADGRPAEATFRFDSALEDPSFVWLQWTGEGYAPFDLPRVGQTVELPAFLERPP